MNYPFELRRREAVAVDQRRQKARAEASPGLPGTGSSAASPTTAADWTSGDLPGDTVGLRCRAAAYVVRRFRWVCCNRWRATIGCGM